MPHEPASDRLVARRRRFARIRRRVAGTAAAVFIALFGTIYVENAKQDTTAKSQTAAVAHAAPASSSSSSPAPVTTSQS